MFRLHINVYQVSTDNITAGARDGLIPMVEGWVLKDKKRLTTFLIALVLLSTCASILFFNSHSSLRVSAVETAASLGVYWDANCSTAVTSIDWGSMIPGQVSSVAFYVRNEGAQVCVLIASIVGWQGDNTSNCLSFSCGSPTIVSSQAVQVTPSLLIFPNASAVNFSFGMLLMGASAALSDFGALFGNNVNVKMIYPSTSSSKPLGCASAMVSDWTASAFVSTKLTNFSEGLDTQASFVNQSTGKALGSSGAGIVSFGGPVVNPVVKYAESSGTVAADRAPLMYAGSGGTCYFRFANGSSIAGASLPASVINTNQDMFLIELYPDGSGRYIFLCYGFGWQGTYAAGKYFDDVLYPNLGSQSESWIVVKWVDSNGNGFVNGPFDGDTYTVVAQGN